jgi:hypothetical protein
MKGERGEGIYAQLFSLAAFQIGVEHKSAIIGILQQNHAKAWPAVGRCRRQGYRRRIVNLGLGRLSQPKFELFEGIFDYVVAHRMVQYHRAVYRSNRNAKGMGTKKKCNPSAIADCAALCG